MNCTALACVTVLAGATGALAGENGPVTWEMEVEIGVDSTFKSDDPTAELTDTYAAVNAAVEIEITENVSFFSEFTFESVLDATSDRTFEDMGLYVGSIGLSFNLAGIDISVGKIGPAFGTAWDTAPGFYGTSFAEDYELGEMLGVTAEVPVGSNGGTLSVALFYADNTALSNSIGTERGQNTVSVGGAGNTGKLNNVALQWSQEFNNTTLTVGARYLSAGTGDVSDETGFVVGFSHAINDNFEVIGEIAAFEGFGGSSDDATYATLGASYGVDDITYSASYTHRDISSAGTSQIISLGVDYEFANGTSLGAGYSFTDDAGTKSHGFGVAIVIPIGG